MTDFLQILTVCNLFCSGLVIGFLLGEARYEVWPLALSAYRSLLLDLREIGIAIWSGFARKLRRKLRKSWAVGKEILNSNSTWTTNAD